MTGDGEEENFFCTVIYGGFAGALKMELVQGEQQASCAVTVPVEKIQVILLGIDGLRQDVLYPKNPQDGMAAESIGEPGTDYYLDPIDLPGIGQLFGRFVGTDGQWHGHPAKHHYRFPDVVNVFPTVTLANWASLYTGAVPKETGLLGNEFFARDLIDAMANEDPSDDIPLHPAPGMHAPGVVSFLDGAFDRSLIDVARLSGAEFGGRFGDWRATPHNRIMRATPTLFEQTRPILTESGIFGPSDASMIGDLQLYARDLDPPDSESPNRWLVSGEIRDAIDATRQHFGLFAVRELRLLDEWPVTFATDYFADRGIGRGARFPALLATYFLFLDHQAHELGHGTNGEQYKSFFRDRTDLELARFVQWMRDHEELHNKLFILTTDHGQTNIQNPPASPDIDLVPCDAGEAAAQLAGSPGDQRTVRKRRDERLRNHTLTSWELAALFTEFNARLPSELLQLRLLAQEPVLSLFSPFHPLPEAPPRPILCGFELLPCPVATNIEDATVIAAMNGPMMHVYVRSRQMGEGGGFKVHPAAVGSDGKAAELALVAEVLKVALTEYVSPFLPFPGEEEQRQDVQENIKDIAGSVSNSVDFILIRENSQYHVFNGIAEDGTVQLGDVQSFLSTRADLPYALERIQFMNDLNRSGDLIVHFKTLLPINRYTSGSSCRGDHGGLSRMESFVPLIASYPGGNKEEFLKWWNELGQAAVCSADSDQGAGNLACHGSWMTTDLIRELIRELYPPRSPGG